MLGKLLLLLGLLGFASVALVSSEITFIEVKYPLLVSLIVLVEAFEIQADFYMNMLVILLGNARTSGLALA